MANIGDVTARLRADVSDYVSGMTRAQQANQQLTASVGQTNQRFLANAQQLQQTTAWYDRTMSSAQGLRGGIDVLKADVQQATADFKAGLISVQDYRTALEQARATALQLRTGGGLNGAEMSALNGILVKTAPQAEAAAAGLGRLTLASGYLASSALGGNFILGRLLGSVTALGISAPAVIGALAGVAGMAFVWSQYTAIIDKADQANQQVAVSLAKVAEQGMSPVVKRAVEAGQSVEAFRVASEKVQTAVNRSRVLTALSTIPGAGAVAGLFSDFFDTKAMQASGDRNTAALAGFVGAEHAGDDAVKKTTASIEEQTFALSHGAEAVALFKAQHDDLGRATDVSALALRRLGRATRDYQDAQIALIARTTLAPSVQLFGQQFATLQQEMDAAAAAGVKLIPVISDLDNALMRQGVRSLGQRGPMDAGPDTRAEDFDRALKEFERAKERAGALSPEGRREAGMLGINPDELSAQLEAINAPLDKVASDTQSRFSRDMGRVGREGIRALVQGIMNGENDLLPLLQRTLIDFLTSGITDLIGGIFSGSFGGGGSVLSGGGGVTGGGGMFGMHVNVGPSRDPMSLARDAQWQTALRESVLVARSQGFK